MDCIKCWGPTKKEGNREICLECGHVNTTLEVQDGTFGQSTEVKENKNGEV